MGATEFEKPLDHDLEELNSKITNVTEENVTSFTNASGAARFRKLNRVITMVIDIEPSTGFIKFNLPSGMEPIVNVYERRDIAGNEVYMYFYSNGGEVVISHTSNTQISMVLTYISKS